MSNISSKEIKQKFIKFFEGKQHKAVPSSSLIPDDPSVLLTTAGMQQFVPYFLGEKSPHGNKVMTVQKCFRTSDIEETGDESHLTFFEMLGNFSFHNAYFKKEAIGWAYEFLTKELGISKDRMWCSVFEGDGDVDFDADSDAALREFGFDDSTIKKFGREDNFWGPSGAEGPCGPTVEFYVDNLEVWNLVFNEYFCSRDGSLKAVESKGVDTGMGFERLVQVLGEVGSVYDTDMFLPIIEKIETISGKKYKENEKEFRVVADHMRGSAFLIVDGILPSNMERGYILRRLLRRSIRYARILSLPENWYSELVDTITERYKEDYPGLLEKKESVLTVISEENAKFLKTLERGIKELNKLTEIDAKKAFDIFQTYGFPLEMIQEELEKKGLSVDEKEFQKEFEAHQEKSRAGLEKKFGGHGLALDTGELKAGSEEDIKKVTGYHTATHLLHQALRQVLGEHVSQRGSDINADRMRFDFTHDEKMTPEQKEEVENIVNEKIKEDLEIKMEEMPFKKAQEEGALAFFRGKYPEIVKVYSIGSFSKEVCGGPHVARTGELGHFRIKKEESSSAGVRRVRALLE